MATRRTTLFDQQAGSSTPLNFDYSQGVQNYANADHALPQFGDVVGEFNPARRNTSYLPDFGALEAGVGGIQEDLFTADDVSRMGSRTRSDLRAGAAQSAGQTIARFGEGGIGALMRSLGTQGAELGANNFMGDLETTNRQGKQAAQFQKANLRNAIAQARLAAQGQQDSFDLANQAAGLQHTGLQLSQRGQDQSYALNGAQMDLSRTLGLGGLQNESARTGLSFMDFLSDQDQQGREMDLRERVYRDSRADAGAERRERLADKAEAKGARLNGGPDKDFIGRLAATTSPDVFGRMFKMFPGIFGRQSGAASILGRLPASFNF